MVEQATVAPLPSVGLGASPPKPARKRGRLLLVGGLIAAPVLCLVIVALVITAGGSGDNSIDLAYLPDELFMLEHARVADAAGTPAGRGLLAENPKFQARVAALEAAAGMRLQDVVSVTIGYRNPVSVQNLPGGFTLTARGQMAYAAVVRLNRACDRRRILQFAGEHTAVQQAGATYYRLPRRGGLAVYFPDERTIVYGTEREVQAAIASGGQAARQPALDAVDPADHFVMAMVLDESEQVAHGQSARLGDGVEFRTWTDCGSPAVARRQKAAQEFVGGATQEMAGLMGGMADRVGVSPTMADKFKRESGAMFRQFQGKVEVHGSVVVTTRSGELNDFFANTFLAGLIKDLLPGE